MLARFATRLVAATLAAAAAWGTRAGAQTIERAPGATYTTSLPVVSVTRGFDMGGMLVTAAFTDGTSSSGVWGDLGGGVWGVNTGSFRLTLGAADDTFLMPWWLLNTTSLGLSTLTLSGAPGRTVFDTWDFPDGTPNSEGGHAMDIVSGDLHRTTAQYFNAVRVGGTAAVGDLYERLEVTFKVPVEDTDQLLFFTDTDTIRKDATLTSAPEPATFGLMALGALAILGVQWRRRRLV